MYKLCFILIVTFIFLNANVFKIDDSENRESTLINKKSHINIFLPSIPYSYISKNTNAGLIRSADNINGWEFDLAEDYIRVDTFTYIFKIRKNLRFQDGSICNIDNIIRNLEYFNKNPLLYTNIDKINLLITKIDEYTLKITLDKKYEMFINDLARIYFYTDEYLEKYKPKGAQTGTANEVAGAFGMGPYILKKGFAIGTKQTSKLELEANPYYWDKKIPIINKVTVYTQLNINEALKMITQEEGKLDLMPVPFNRKIDILMSKYSKLIINESTNNFLIFFNLISGNKELQNKDVRIALNEAINQENLLNFVYKKEGKVSPFSASVNYKVVRKIQEKKEYKEFNFSEEKIKNLLNGLVLNVLTQDRFVFLLKGIEFQLKKYGVKFKYTITNSEKDIYKQLLNTKIRKNTKKWDLLMWGDDDWYTQNPWTVFFIYENNSPWSTIKNDKKMNEYISKYFQTKANTKEFEKIVEQILYKARNEAYTLRLPSPNKVMAVNKEVIFKPTLSGIIPLWKIRLTKDHWSIRKNKEYNKDLYAPIKTIRIKNEF